MWKKTQIISVGVAVVAVVGGFVTTLAGVSPTDAVTNLAAWAKLVGIDQVPDFINDPTVNKYIFYVGIATTIVFLSISIILLYRKKKADSYNSHEKEISKAPLPETDMRIPFVDIKQLAIENGWDINGGDTPSQNLTYDLEIQLRQAALDGEISFFGRKCEKPIGTNPLVKIPKEHFEEFEFWHGCLFYNSSNEKSHTGEMGKDMHDFDGRNYCDLHVSENDIKKFFNDGEK